MEANLQNLSNCIRVLSMDAVEKAKSGHPGMPMGMADVATVLFLKHLKFDPKNPNWLDRDRFILSAGHGSMLLYSLLYLTGYEDITIEEIKNFRQLGAKTCGHPEYGEAAGIETTTGPLGQGLANSVGFAIAEKLLENRYGSELFNHHTYVIAGDGCLMEGISQEAISLAGHLKLNKLIVLFDDNEISIDGPTSLSTSDNQLKRFEASSWNVMQIDGHNFEEIDEAIEKAKTSDKPTLIACKTTIGKSAPTKAGTAGSHGAPLGTDEIKGAKEALGWTAPEFEIPSNLLDKWREFGKRSSDAHKNWSDNFENSENKAEITRIFENSLPEALELKISEIKKEFIDSEAGHATRKSSGICLEKITEIMPELIGGSADLTGSNLTKAQLNPISPDDFSGRYIYYGIREHAMAAAMNGIQLHGGFRPYGGTFFVFTDYCRPSIRLSALMKQGVIYVMTHDSIGLGEDGPTHQPVEHLASLRAMPNVCTLRPADAVETAECWQIALENTDKPTILVLTRQGLPLQRKDADSKNLSKLGAYTLIGETNPDVVLLASGSEVSLAVEAHKKLKEQNINARIISFASFDLFEQQSQEYKNSVLGDENTPKIAIEAGCGFGWEKYIGRNGKFIGMQGFGASAPAKDLYQHFGITTENIVKTAKSLIS